MENKKIDVLFGLVVIAFLALMFIFIKDYKAMHYYRDYADGLSGEIKVLSSQLVIEIKENVNLKNTLAETKSDLEALTKKLAQQASGMSPATAPAPAVK